LQMQLLLDGMQLITGIKCLRLTCKRYNGMMKMYQNENWLKKRFLVDKKSPEDIAKECGVSLETIYVYLGKFGLRKSRRK
jgi:hypothetical protein